jgi:hypothetical protein
MYFLIGRIVDWLTRKLAGPVFRGFFRAVKACPPLFAIAAGAGFGLGGWLTLLANDPDPVRRLALRVAGFICLAFYGLAEAVFVVKYSSGTWSKFCDDCQSQFRDQE